MQSYPQCLFDSITPSFLRTTSPKRAFVIAVLTSTPFDVNVEGHLDSSHDEEDIVLRWRFEPKVSEHAPNLCPVGSTMVYNMQ